MRFDIVVPEGLLEPVDIEIGGIAAEALGRGQVPAAVAIDGDGYRVAHRLADAPDARETGGDSGLSVSTVGNLTDLVADIAASGKRAKSPVRLARQDG